MDLLSGDYNASVIGWSMIICGLVTGLLNGLIARNLSESPRKGVIVGLGVGFFLSLLAPLFLLFRLYVVKRKQHV